VGLFYNGLKHHTGPKLASLALEWLPENGSRRRTGRLKMRYTERRFRDDGYGLE